MFRSKTFTALRSLQPRADSISPMHAKELSVQDIRHFHEYGYLIIRDLVPEDLRTEALRAINHDLGKGVDPGQVAAFNRGSWCPGIRKEPMLTELVNATCIPHLAQQLMGEGNLQLPIEQAQIALRFPRASGEHKPFKGHLDGIVKARDGSDGYMLERGFTGLCVVLLSDLPDPFAGNFTVWPGSHRRLEQWFRENGHEKMNGITPRIDYPHEPVQCCGRAGDVMISHHQVVHEAAPNLSPHVRYAAIFRLRHVDVRKIGISALTDVWREWHGVRKVIEESV